MKDLVTGGRDRQVYPDYRWIILALLFCATTVNYLDRIVLGNVAATVKADLGLSDQQYGYIVSAVSAGYAVGLLLAGRLMDFLGARFGYLLAIAAWSAVTCLTGLSNSLPTLFVAQCAMGLVAAGNFPAAIKAVAEWFPARQRSLATSLFNSGPSVALVVGPPIIAWILIHVGSWRLTFVLMGSLGFLLAAVWPFIYRRPAIMGLHDPSVDPPKAAKLRWSRLLTHRETLGIMVGKFCTDPVWWFYIAWLPSYLAKNREFDIMKIGLTLPVIYGLAILGGNLAGWTAGFLIRRGWAPRNARKIVMLTCAVCMPLSAFAVYARLPWAAILLISLANAAHNGWSANIFTLVGDCFKPAAVGSVTGLIGFAGGVGGIIISGLASGYIIEHFGYVPIFLLMGILHPVAMLFVHLFVKPGEPIDPRD
ncbi:MAG: MFS transporter [Phycisphaerae bacterium]|nr:MFS transporter [Phycisphaerae bacterium]